MALTQRGPDSGFTGPNSPWPVYGHESTVALLRRSLEAGEVHHAYLFCGPAHIGKRTLTHVFAQAILCLADDAAARPCGQCTACLRVRHGNHPDVRIIEPEPGKRILGIDAIREVQRGAGLRPYEGRRKIYILPHAELMNKEAANCLLKTLEEPASETMLLLNCTEISLLLPTILSRCRQMPLYLVSAADSTRALQERWAVAPEMAASLGRLAAGRLGWAVSAVEDPPILERRQEWLSVMAALPLQDRVPRMQVAARWASDSETLRTILEIWVGWWRDVLLAEHGCTDLIVNSDFRESIEQQAALCPPRSAWQFIRALKQALQDIEQNGNPRLVAEVLMLDLPLLGPAVAPLQRR